MTALSLRLHDFGLLFEVPAAAKRSAMLQCLFTHRTDFSLKPECPLPKLCSIATLLNTRRAPLVEGHDRQQPRRERPVGRREEPPDRLRSAYGPTAPPSLGPATTRPANASAPPAAACRSRPRG